MVHCPNRMPNRVPDDKESSSECESRIVRAGISATWTMTEHNLFQVVVEGTYTSLSTNDRSRDWGGGPGFLRPYLGSVSTRHWHCPQSICHRRSGEQVGVLSHHRHLVLVVTATVGGSMFSGESRILFGGEMTASVVSGKGVLVF